MTNITIRKGISTDISWVTNLLIEGTQSGHFPRTLAVQAPDLLGSILNSGGITMTKLRGEIQAPRFVFADILVAEVDGNPVSFLIPIRDVDGVELHLAGTKKPARRKGHFRKLIQYEIGRHNNGTRIFARCYSKSTWALEGLKKEGFNISKEGNPVELTLCR